MEVKELNIHDDDEFIQQITKRREFIEKITIMVSIIFCVNTVASFLVIEKLFNRTDQPSSSWMFAGLYIENIVVVAAILIVFNKYKF